MKVQPPQDTPGQLRYTTRQINNKSEPNTGTGERLAYSVSEVAAMLNLSTKSVRRLANRGLLKPCKALRHLRFTRADVENLLANR